MQHVSHSVTNFTSHVVHIDNTYQIYVIYLGEKSYYNGRSLCNSVILQSSMCLDDGSNTNLSIHMRAVFITKVVVYPKAII